MQHIKIFLLVLISISSLFGMDTAPKPLQLITISDTTDFFSVTPTDVKRKIGELVALNNPGANVRALGLTNKFFAKYLLNTDQQFTTAIIQAHAKRFRHELSEICPHDLEFAAAYGLGTAGARRWLTTYFEHPMNSKIITQSFFQLLTPGNPHTKGLQNCIKATMPLSALTQCTIQRKLFLIAHSAVAQSPHFPKEFIKKDLRFNSSDFIGPYTESIQNARFNYHSNDAYANPNELFQYMDKHSAEELSTKISPLSLSSAGLGCSLLDISTLKGEILLVEALKSRLDVDKAKVLLNAGANPDNLDHTLEAPIFCALTIKNPTALTSLLKAGANPDIYAREALKKGTTPLIKAVHLNWNEGLKILLQEGKANPNLPDKSGIFPLEYAIRDDHPADVELLLQAGARLTSTNPLSEETPIQLAQRLNKQAILELFAQHEQKLHPPQLSK